MKPIDCPTGNSTSESCSWESIPGQVRDFPSVGLKECAKCHLVTHRKDLRNSINYGLGSMHIWAGGYGGTLNNPKEDVSRRLSAINQFTLTKQIESILDFGSGDGEMLVTLSEFYEVVGLEPEDQARNLSLTKNLDVYASTEELQNRKLSFDLVTLFHVIEHFYSPFLELERIYDLLKPGGYLLVETPNSQDALLKKYKVNSFTEFTYWSHHPMLHSSVSLKNLLVNSGFEIVEESGIQRYGLSNHMYWLLKGQPGGHVYWEDMFSSNLEELYREEMIFEGASDTLWFFARKPSDHSS